MTWATKDHGPANLHVGRRLRQARIAAGLSQRELSLKLWGYPASARVCGYETNARAIPIPVLAHMAETLGYDVAWFFPPPEGVGPFSPEDMAGFQAEAWALHLNARLRNRLENP